MITRRNAELRDGLYLLTLAESCHYVLLCDQATVLFDPGHISRAELLKKRLEQFSLVPTHLALTHTHAERAGAIEAFNELPVICSQAAAEELKLGARFITVESLQLTRANSPVHIRAIHAGIHTKASQFYQITPHKALIVDEGLGYLRGKMLPALGADTSIKTLLDSIPKFVELNAEILCLPWSGALTGSFVKRFILQSKESYQVLEKKRTDDSTFHDLALFLEDELYTSPAPDKLLERSMNRSLQELTKQLTV